MLSIVMKRLTHLGVYPGGGHSDRPWDDSVAVVAFARSLIQVTGVFSAVLEGADLPYPSASLRFMCVESDDDVVKVTVHVDGAELASMAAVRVPESVLSLSVADRRELAIEMVAGALNRLGVARDWDLGEVERCRREAESFEFGSVWHGAWKTSPDRRLRARGCFRVEHDGYGRVALEVQTRSGEHVALSPEAVTYADAGFHRRAARTVRWVGSDSVLLLPREDHESDLVRLDRGPEGEGWRPTVVTLQTYAPPTSAESQVALPEVSVQGEGPSAPEARPVISVCGGGPTNDVSPLYLEALHRQLHLFGGEEGQEWWQAAGIYELRVFHWFDVVDPKVSVRRYRDHITASIERSPESTHVGDPGVLARADVESLVAAVRRRADLPRHPLFAT